VKQFFLQGEIDGVAVRWLVLRSADGAVMLLDEHLVQEVVSSTWATTTFSRLDVKEATDARPGVGTDPPAYTVTLGSGTIVVGYLVKAQRASKLVTSNTLYDFRSAHVPWMVGEFLVTVCFALGCALLACGVLYLAAKMQAGRRGSTEDIWR
jgi:hypothetical protein